MKKTLLYAFSLASFGVFAQDCIDAKGFNEDFTAAGPTTDGTYSAFWWGKKSAAGTEENNECSGEQKCIDFTHTATRSGNGDLELSITQPENGWTPIGFGLQNADNSAWVDVTSSNQVEVSLTNDGSVGIEVYFTFISNGTSGANAKLATATSTGTLYGGAVAAGATMTKTFDVSAGRKHTWIDVNDPAKVTECTSKGGTVAGSYCLEDKGFDPMHLSGVEFSINGEGTSDPMKGWIQPAITNHPVKLHYVRGGDLALLGNKCTNGTDDIAYNDLSIYPNPATNVLNVNFESQVSTTVTMTDLTGKVVLTQQGTIGNNALTFSTSTITTGVYFVNIQSVSGNYTQKVIVK